MKNITEQRLDEMEDRLGAELKISKWHHSSVLHRARHVLVSESGMCTLS